MQKANVILVTGATDGIGRVTAHSLLEAGCHVLIHGRNKQKLEQTKAELLSAFPQARLQIYHADLLQVQQVIALAETIKKDHQRLDVLINNAGVFKLPVTQTEEGLDVRFVVNTLAPYLLTKLLLPVLSEQGRVVNLSSAAQAPVEPSELLSTNVFSDSAAYAKSKLAITMWSRHLAAELEPSQQVIVAVNPASMLGSKMVKEAYGVAGGSLQLGADILVRAALSDEFAAANGLYFDNDIGQFASPHPDATDKVKSQQLTKVVEDWANKVLQSATYA